MCYTYIFLSVRNNLFDVNFILLFCFSNRKLFISLGNKIDNLEIKGNHLKSQNDFSQRQQT